MSKELKQIDGYYDEYRVTEDGIVYGKYGKQLKQKIVNRRCYVGIRDKTQKQKQVSVSRIVAKAFCEVPTHLRTFDLSELEVHHIDKNPLNNHYSNLLWVSKEEHEKIHECENREKCVFQIKDNVIVGLYNSRKQAAKETGIPIQNISDCVNGTIRNNKRRISAGGYKWTNKLEGEYVLSLQPPIVSSQW